MACNNNFSNFNGNLYYTPTSVDSDITNPAFYNSNQLSMPDWSYPNQYMPYSQYYEQDWIIITILHRVNRDITPPSHIVNTLPTSSFIYSFSWVTIRRINWLGKEDESLRRALATNSNFRRLKIPLKFSNHRPLLYFSRRIYRLRKVSGIHAIW